MWTYSPGSLSSFGIYHTLADILWPLDDSPVNDLDKTSVLKRLDLRPEDLENESIRKMLESECPEIVERMLVVAWLRRPEVPYYKIYELCEHLTKFSEYLRFHKNEIIRYGKPSQPFLDSPWLHEGISNLYPIESVINQIHGEEFSRILRQELFTTKIDVVEYLAKNLRAENPADVSKQAMDLALGGYSKDRIRMFDELEEAHFQEQIRHGIPKNIIPPGGFTDIVNLIAYCEKECVIGTFNKAKQQFEKLSHGDHLSCYIKMFHSTKKEQFDNVIYSLQLDLDTETDFYREYSTRTQKRQAVDRVEKMIGKDRDYMFFFTGHNWNIRWNGGEKSSFQNLKGFHYIAYLLKNPYKEFDISTLYMHVNPSACIELLSNPITDEDADAMDWEDNPTMHDGTGIKKTDEKTIEAVRAKIRKIDHLLKSRISVKRKQELKKEQKQCKEYLSSSSNIRGQSRLTGDKLANLRIKVTHCVKYAKNKLHPLLPELADHLDKYLCTQKTCIYAPPDDNIKWNL